MSGGGDMVEVVVEVVGKEGTEEVIVLVVEVDMVVSVQERGVIVRVVEVDMVVIVQERGVIVLVEEEKGDMVVAGIEEEVL